MEEEQKKEPPKEKRHKLMPSISVGSRQIDLMKKHYEVDEENKVVTLTFRFDKASELLDTEIGRKDHPQFSPDVIEKMKSLIDTVPMNYRVEVEFDIREYEGYDPKSIMESFNDSLELTQYAARRTRKSKWLISTILILIGIMLLFVMAVGKNNSWFGDGVNQDIITEIIDIAGWVFIWEAVSLLFLEPTEQSTFALKIRQKIVGVAFYQQGDDTPFVKETAEEIFSNWSEEGKVKRFGKACLLGSSAAFIAMGFVALFSLYTALKNASELTPLSITALVIFSLITMAYHLLAGFGGIHKYIGKENWLSRCVGPIAIFMTVMLIITIVVSAITNSVSGLVSSITSSIINIFYIGGYFIDKYMN